jgi:hypothetical protein
MNKTYGEENFGQTIWHFLPGIIKFLSVLGIGLVIFNLINISLAGSSINSDLDQASKTDTVLVRTYNPKIGNPDSNLKLVYFLDYQCPVCGANAETMTQLKADYKDTVQFVYKHYPIKTAHVYAEPAAKAIQAATLQNKGFELGDIILARQNEGFSPAKFSDWARELGLDMEKFESDRGSSLVNNEVILDQADYDGAEFPKSTVSGESKPKGQVGGTPTTVLIKDGNIVDWWSGRPNIDTVKSKLDEYLK